MTCPHCGFENQDTNQSCFRCGQVLDLSDLEVEPECLRRGTPSSPWAERWHVLWNRRPAVRFGPRVDASLSAFLSIVPGLGHLVLGEPRRALVVLGAYLGALGIAMLTDPPLAPVADIVVDWFFHPRWLPLTVHAWIMGDAYQRRLRQHGRRADLLEVLVVSLVAVGLLLGPTTLEIGRMAMNYRQGRVNYPLEDPNVRMGDTLLIRVGTPAAVPRGAVVFFSSHDGQLRDEAVGTVRAVGTDVVEWSRDEGLLRVNGLAQEVPTWLAGALGSTPRVRLVLASDELLVLPIRPQGFTELSQAVIRERDVQGMAVRILEPASHRKYLRTR